MRVRSLFLATALATTGCYGQFALTKSFHQWNGGFQDKWVRSLIFFGLAVVQAYTICVLGDGIIFNTVEFWSGKNPVASVEPDGSIKIAADGHEHVLVPLENGRYRLEVDGQSVGEAERMPDGAIALVDGNGLRSVFMDAPAAQ